ncbi:ABC transporter substrate-binding protein [Nocardioides panacihumi]|uniref:ABC transporter substrate-binding protein n=1 Tax=Nocardioides panacihumi TaxID=400774 RepID=A0ABP5BMZ6_9ACTN
MTRVGPVRTRIAALSAALLATVALASGCGGSSSATNSDGTTTVRYQSSQGSVDLLQLADALGYLKGVKLKKVGDVTGGPESLKALASRQIDIGASAFYGAVAQLVATGVPIKAVVSTYGSNGPIASVVATPTGSGITSARDLIGKKVAVNTLGANAEAVLDTWFQKEGLTPEEIRGVTLVPLPPLNTAQALKEHQVDAAYIGLGQLKAASEAVPLSTLVKDTDVVGNYNGGGFTLRDDFIAKHHQAAQTLATGVGKAVDYIASHDRADVLKVYEKWLTDHGYAGYVDAVEKNWPGATGVASPHGSISDEDIARWIDWLDSRGDVDAGKLEASDVYTNDLNKG